MALRRHTSRCQGDTSYRPCGLTRCEVDRASRGGGAVGVAGLRLARCRRGVARPGRGKGKGRLWHGLAMHVGAAASESDPSGLVVRRFGGLVAGWFGGLVVWWFGGFLGSRGAEEAEVASYGATQMGLSTCCAGVRREGGEAAGLRKPAVEWEMFSLSPKWSKRWRRRLVSRRSVLSRTRHDWRPLGGRVLPLTELDC